MLTSRQVRIIRMALNHFSYLVNPKDVKCPEINTKNIPTITEIATIKGMFPAPGRTRNRMSTTR